MQFDHEKKMITLEGREPDVLRRSGEKVRTEWSYAEALTLASQIAAAQNRICDMDMDITGVPPGSARAEQQATREQLLRTATAMGRLIQPFLPIVDENSAQQLLF